MKVKFIGSDNKHSYCGGEISGPIYKGGIAEVSNKEADRLFKTFPDEWQKAKATESDIKKLEDATAEAEAEKQDSGDNAIDKAPNKSVDEKKTTKK